MYVATCKDLFVVIMIQYSLKTNYYPFQVIAIVVSHIYHTCTVYIHCKTRCNAITGQSGNPLYYRWEVLVTVSSSSAVTKDWIIATYVLYYLHNLSISHILELTLHSIYHKNYSPFIAIFYLTSNYTLDRH